MEQIDLIKQDIKNFKEKMKNLDKNSKDYLWYQDSLDSLECLLEELENNR